MFVYWLGGGKLAELLLRKSNPRALLTSCPINGRLKALAEVSLAGPTIYLLSRHAPRYLLRLVDLVEDLSLGGTWGKSWKALVFARQ